MRFTLATAAALAFAALVGAQSSADNANGQRFYITEPACDSYKCQVHVKPNDTLHINWLNPVNGRINILLVPEPKQKKLKLKTYTIASKVAAHSNDDACDKAGASSCGMYDWKVPSNVKPGKYSIDIHSLHKKGVHGYSDIVTVDAPAAAPNTTKPVATPTPQRRGEDGVPRVPAGQDDVQPETEDTTKKSTHKKDSSKKKKSGKKTKSSGSKTTKSGDKKKHHHDGKNSTTVAEHHHKNATTIEHHHHNSTSTKHDGKKTKKDSKKSKKEGKKSGSKKTKEHKKATKVNAKRRMESALY